MVEEFLTKDTDGTVRKYQIDYDATPMNPRDPNNFTNLGKMVFIHNSSSIYKLGEEQVESFEDLFKRDLPSEQIKGSYRIRIPTLEEAKNSEELSKYVAGNEEFGEHFDKDLFNQDMDYLLSNLYEELGKNILDDITGGIPIDEVTNHLTDEYVIEFTTAAKTTYSEANGYCLQAVKNAVNGMMKENFGLSDYYRPYDTESIDAFEALTEKDIYNKWKETKVCVLPIGVYEHSGISCHETSEDFNQYDELRCDGLIYVEKDNEEIQMMKNGFETTKNGETVFEKPKSEEEIKELAEKNCRNEIELYNSYLTGQVFVVNRSEYNPVTRDFEDNWCGGFFGSDGNYESMCRDAGMADTEEKYDIGYEASLCKELDTEDFVKKLFFEEAKKLLPDYNDNPEMAFITQLKLWEHSSNRDRADRIKNIMSHFIDKKDFNFELIKNMDVKVNAANLHLLATKILPEEDISHHASDLYIARSPKADWLKAQMTKSYSKLMRAGDSAFFSTFKDNITGKASYDFGLCYSEEVAAKNRKRPSEEWDKYKKHSKTCEEKSR